MQLAVSHGKLNEGTKVRHLSELNDPKYKYFRQNNNPLDVVYREKAKFDVQNPIIGDLLKEINKGKLSEEEYFKKTKTAPDIKDLDIKERFDRVFEIKKRKKKTFLIGKTMMTMTMILLLVRQMFHLLRLWILILMKILTLIMLILII